MWKYKGSLTNSLEVQHDSTVGYGSEFCDVKTLLMIFWRYPNWARMSWTLTTGSEWPLKPLNKEHWQEDVNKALAFGNHKGASLQPKVLQQLVLKDVHFGYCLPLPLVKARKIPSILLAPMNIQKQNSINKLGPIVEKDRLIHNQSIEWSSGTSINNPVKMDKLLPCMFGAGITLIVN
jgi:hypothetical protein